MKLFIALCAAFCAALVPMAAFGAGPQQAGLVFGDWEVSTGEVNTNWQTGAFSTPVPVTMVRPGARIRADRATGNWKTRQANLAGDVRVYDQTGTLASFGGRRPSSLTCDSLQVDGNTKIYVATGRVYFKQGTSWALADRAVMDGNTHDLHLYGHVRLHQ